MFKQIDAFLWVWRSQLHLKLLNLSIKRRKKKPPLPLLMQQAALPGFAAAALLSGNLQLTHRMLAPDIGPCASHDHCMAMHGQDARQLRQAARAVCNAIRDVQSFPQCALIRQVL
jgi:hypothetical protein